MSQKGRLSVSVDADLIEAAARGVAAGRARNVSEWVSAALRLKAEEDARLQAMAAFIADYEKEHGAFSDDEVEGALDRLRSRSAALRGKRRRSRRTKAA